MRHVSRFLICGALAASLCVLMPLAALSQTVFDFEDQVLSPAYDSGDYTVLTSTKDGITVTITRPGTSFGVFNLSAPSGPGAPPTWGTHTLTPFFDTSGAEFVATFSVPINYAYIEFGDYGQDADTGYLTLGVPPTGPTGSVTGLPSSSILDPSPFGVGLWLPTGSTQTARFGGGSVAYPQSLYFDNLTVTAARAPVPEPGVLSLAASGLLAGVPLLMRLRARRR